MMQPQLYLAHIRNPNMTNARQPSGLMQSDTTDNITRMKDAILGTSSQIPKPLNERLGALNDIERGLLETYARFALMMMKMQYEQYGHSKESYNTLISRINKGMQPELKSTLVELLETIAPIEVREEPKAKPNGMSFYSNPQFFPQDLQQKVNDRIDEFKAAAKPDDDTPVPFVRRPTQQPEQLTFLDRLVASESSGQSDAEITLDDGRKYVGLMQMGEARLEDYKRATNTSFTQEQFKNDTELQDKVGNWHLADIDKNIDAMGDEAKGYSRDGLRAVAHLGGVGGMKKYVKSKGQYNPSDQLGTSLKDYYNKFSGEA